MHSTPVASPVTDNRMSSPPSSPPSSEEKDKDYDPVTERMEEEEQRMRAKAQKEEAEDKKRTDQWSKAGQAQQKGQFNKLMHLVEQSKVFATIMQQRMHQEEEKQERMSKRDKEKEVKRKEEAEKVAVSSQRRSTRNPGTDGIKTEEKSETNGVQDSPSKQLPTRGRGKLKKEESGTIKDWLKKEDLNDKSGGLTVAQAVAEAAEDHDVKTDGFGATNLRSDNQPKAVTGGVMRGYQLEGLYWLRSLYENGLNGILADEMGLGKTIQTISFLAFLREMKSYGPFLIVAPLSTLGNWIDEFARWTPEINTVLYHGNPTDRAEIRKTQLNKPGSESFPVVCTSYEICMNDRKFLAQYGWKFIIIDEGHRLKNLNCRLIKELKQYQSANRLLITGTPLQNNLAELWSLLNFLMPEVFDTLDNFESFFDFSAVLEKGGHKDIIEKEQKNSLVASLHAILKPFLLRRVKTDVETDLPPKREYVLYAPLTNEQKELYKQILEGNSRSYLEQQAIERITEKNGGKRLSTSSKRKADDAGASNKSAKSSRASTPGSARSATKKSRGRPRKSYKEVSDRQYFKELDESSSNEDEESQDDEEIDRARTIELAKREIGNKKLQNPVMQLRLACNSPHNFYWPFAENQDPDNSIVTASGKMLLLDKLVPHLFKYGHKVLIFSQFKTQLDILEDWAAVVHNWNVCRIDGSVPQDERRQMIKNFNSRKDVNLFLLSTRAGGQGINLAAADTVVLFDSDWNPQQDLQAQDRAHRIGQTRPVIVYRLSTRGTVEQTLLEKADGKRRLEKLVIRKGKFKSLKSGSAGADDMDELAKILEHQDGESWDGEAGLLSDKDLKVLTDRSQESYRKAAEDGGEGERFRAVETRRDGGVLEGVTRK